MSRRRKTASTRRLNRLRSPADIVHFYFSFTGRISLRAYWRYWTLPLLLVLAVGQACLAAGCRFQVPPIANLLLIWPVFAVSAKRLHDIDLSGRWLLLHLIPVAGSLVIVLCNACIPGTKGKMSTPEKVRLPRKRKRNKK